MNYKLSITPEAEEDLKKTYMWYESKRKGLGHDFLLQIEAKLRLLKREPYLFPEQYKRVRRCLINRFPYKIFYTVDNLNIVVIAVTYGGRNPEWIIKRIKNA